ncbi:amidase [Nocardia grenadensis]|uniref:amidase n=1 Tax=Nocardia grenadensis TaxID=931537 RepID=UPI0007A3F3B7|nr:amidase [Nocardia grenadensis]
MGALNALSGCCPFPAGREEGAAPRAAEILVKENIEVAGAPFSCGSATRATVRGTRDAECVTALRRAGFHIAGITRCDEFAYGCTGEANAYGPCRNPHDLERITGGSSSGSAAAVAAGLARYALGTDTGGSVRIPAALCGVYGFKPAFGSVGIRGVFPLSPSLDHVGIIADSLAALVAVWRALSGGPAVDPRRPAPRLGLADAPEVYVLSQEVDRVWRQVVHDLELTRRAPLTGLRDAHIHGPVVQGFEAHRIHAGTLRERPEGLQPAVRERLEQAASISRPDYESARSSMLECRLRAADGLGDVDVVLLPTVAVVAPLLGTESVVLGGERVSVRETLLRNTRPANFSGLPALTLPLPQEPPACLSGYN